MNNVFYRAQQNTDRRQLTLHNLQLNGSLGFLLNYHISNVHSIDILATNFEFQVGQRLAHDGNLLIIVVLSKEYTFSIVGTLSTDKPLLSEHFSKYILNDCLHKLTGDGLREKL